MNRSLIKYFVFFFISISSCSSDDNKPSNPYEDYILADYIIRTGITGNFKNFDVKDDEVYVLSTNYSDSFIYKINPNGILSSINTINNYDGNWMGITQSEGNLYCVNDFSNKIYNYSINSSTATAYTVTPTSRMSCIKKFDNNSFVVYDYHDLGFYHFSGLIRYFPNENYIVEIAGSVHSEGNSSIIDGIGENASIKFISQMLVVNEVIYVIDGRYNLRKIEKVGDNFSVTTLISEYPNKFNDIAIDANGNILVLIDTVGIFKLNISNNTLEEYLTGKLDIYTENNTSTTSTDWSFINRFNIYNNDIYIKEYKEFIKISNYMSKLGLSEQ